MKRIAYLTGASWRGKPMAAGQLPDPEAEDLKLLAPAAEAAGLAFDVVRWNEASLLGGPHECALIRSCWDYPERPAEFLNRLDALEATGVRVFNAAARVRWNARKTYLNELAHAGAPTIPTMFSDKLDARAVLEAFDTFDAAELVAKPQIGAGSRSTIRIRRNGWSEMDLLSGPQTPAMLQPFLPAIESAGERSLFYFGGAYSHAVIKHPAPGKWFANVDGAHFATHEPTKADRDAADHVIAASPADLLYARVDFVTGPQGAPLLIELEAIEPYLFLNFCPEGAVNFVRALAAAVAS